mgnify:CR=1 FL=1
MKGDRKMKYKTSEAIAMLEKNPKLQFKSIPELYMTPAVLKSDDYKGIQVTTLDGKCDVCYRVNDTWELIQQPIPFMEAVKAYSEGKTIRCEIGNNEPSFYSREVAISVLTGKKIYGSTCLIDNHGGTITTEEILEGTWYVEDSNE